jgi:hypothetical protein
MDETTTRVDFETAEPDPLAVYTEALLAQANAENIPSGILHWSYMRPYHLAEYDGDEWRSGCDQPTWMQLYSELHQGQKRDLGIASTDSLRASLSTWHGRGEVPIAIAHYRYDTPKRSFVASAMSAFRKNEVAPQPASADRILEQKTAFFCSALLPDRSHGFELLPHVHFGLETRFVVPRSLYLTNVAGDAGGVEIDFDDGQGFRPVLFDEPVTVSYGDELPKQIRLRTTVAGKTLGGAFGFRLHTLTAPTPNDTWPLQGTYNNITAYGTAWVFYGAGHSAITDPMIFADGFGDGSTDLNTIWGQLDQQSLATILRARGKDLIILGYKNKAEYIQANAMVAVACIRKAIERRSGTNKLVVAGASMGGLVTKWALLYMQANNIDAQTSKFLTYDSPHDGAWVPTILQYFSYYFEGKSDSAKRLANLVRSPAAQQLLWGWIPAWDYSGPITNNPLRATLNSEFAGWGGLPRVPRKYAIANGTGNGSGNGVPAGVKAFDWSGNACVGARPNTEPASGTNMPLGDMWLGTFWNSYTATNVPPFDGAPGGMGDFFGTAGDGAAGSGYGWTTIYYRSSCFIPSVSALSTGRMLDPSVNISTLPGGSIPFDEWTASSVNTNHVQVTAELLTWILQRFAPTFDAVAEPAERRHAPAQTQPRT